MREFIFWIHSKAQNIWYFNIVITLIIKPTLYWNSCIAWDKKKNQCFAAAISISKLNPYNTMWYCSYCKYLYFVRCAHMDCPLQCTSQIFLWENVNSIYLFWLTEKVLMVQFILTYPGILANQYPES